MTSLGKFQAAWKVEKKGYTLSYSVPTGTRGLIVLPFCEEGKMPSVVVDGRNVRSEKLTRSDEGVMMEGEGGSHEIVVK